MSVAASAETLSRCLLTLFPHRYIARLLDTINVLAGRMAATGEVSADDAQRSHKRSRDTDVGDGGAITLSSILHIEVLLGRREVEHLLAAAPTATTREAWRTGGAPDAAYAQHRRLRIVAMLNSGKADFNGRDELRHLYDEGRKWFEQGAGRGSVCC